MPFFLKPESGSGVSDLLDERLRNLTLQLKESEKACQALLPSVETFMRGTREMCRGAGDSASAFGAALDVDAARTEGHESQYPSEEGRSEPRSSLTHGHYGDGERVEGAENAEKEGGSNPQKEPSAKDGSDMSGVLSGESMRAELLAMQLMECANEMEDYLRAQVVQPIQRVLDGRNDVQAALRERLLIADSLAAAHSDYAKSVSRYQSSIFDNVNGGPPLEVVQLGDRVVGASDAFAEAHGRAEEALTALLEERGRCLREASSSLKAAQAGFFVRASRCVSSSVAWESPDHVLSRAAGGDLQLTTRSTAEESRKAPAASPTASPEAPAAAADAADAESGTEGGEADAADGQTRSGVFRTGIDDRGKVTGKWRKSGDRDGIRKDSSKRRRSSGWFKRLASSFQGVRPRSASEELREGASLPLHEIADDYDSGGDDEKKLCLRSIATTTVTSVEKSKGKLLFGEDLFLSGKASPRHGHGAEFAAGAVPNSDEGASELAAEGTERTEGGYTASGGAGSGGEEAQAETEEDTDYETGSNSTEGFGTDDAGDLWDGRRSTLMGPLGRPSLMPNDHGLKGEDEEEEWHVPAEQESSGDEPDGEGSGREAAGFRSVSEQEAGVELTPGMQAGIEGVGVGKALIEEGEASGSGAKSPGLDVHLPVSTASATLEAKNPPYSEECEGDHGGGGLSDNRNVPEDGAEGAKIEEFESPMAIPRSSFFTGVSPSRAPRSILPVLPEPELKGDMDPLPPVAVQQPTSSPFSKFDSSPAISDGSSGGKESPRAWRLSWWARAGDRHPPPPPADDEETGGGTGTSFAAALAAAAGGEEASAAAPSAGGAFAPSRNAGDTPAVVDDGGERTASLEEALKIAAAGTVAEIADERQARRRLIQRRRERPWLSKDKLADAQTRPLEAGLGYLDVVALARAGVVCRAWRKPLSGEEGRRRWMRCVRLADGVPQERRAMFYLHILYDQPSWVQKAHGSSSSERPRPGVYQECLEKAEADEEETSAAKEMQRQSEEEERNGRASPPAVANVNLWQVSGGPRALRGRNDADDPPPSTPKCHKWLEEIETDVLRTCPGDDVEADDAVSEFDGVLSQKASAAAAPGRGKVSGSSFDTTRMSSGWSRVRFSMNRTTVGSSGRGGAEVLFEGGGSGAIPTKRFSVTGGGMRDKLRRVLRAFAVYNRRVSYCQGMNFVALALLEACEGDDENAFWILAGMCENLELAGLWCQGLERLDLCFFSLDRLLRRHCPSLRQHLSDEGVELSMFTSRWFVTLFTSTDVFGRSTSRKILDMFLVEGWPLLFKMSLGVLLEMRPLLEPADMEGILKVTKFPRAHLFGLRRDGSGRHIAGASFEEATQGSLCESIRAGQMVEHALLLHVSEETLEQHRREYRLQKHAEPGSD